MAGRRVDRHGSAFIIAAIAVFVAFLQLRQARNVAEVQLKQQREAAAEQLQQSRIAAENQVEQSREAAAAQLALDRAAMNEQRKQALDAALDQSRPYVFLSFELSPISFNLIDLIVQNAGSGPAFDVKLKVDPPLRRANEVDGHEIAKARIFTEPMPILPPHFRLRPHFDSANERHNSNEGLPETHDVTIEYHDGRGNSWRESAKLDLSVAAGLLFAEEYGIHHTAQALRDIRDLLKRSKLLNSPIAVTVEDRSHYLERVQTEREELRQQHEALTARLLGQRQGMDEPPASS
ncbi:hypothetical protein [Micromonospora ureilytica]|uniref:hypothetical protein n=1 Tax=Micromonospora ureilytica TaxID=709868 RepID=UPI000F5DB959|nr:hypothetical protein [Micromonospora ureilytica]